MGAGSWGGEASQTPSYRRAFCESLQTSANVVLFLLQKKGGSKVLFHATYLALGQLYFHILLALTSVLFALTYFGTCRWVLRLLSNRLGLMHFALATIGFFLLSMSLFGFASAVSTDGLEANQTFNYWRLLLVGVFCFLSGCALFAVNFVWAVTKVRPCPEAMPQ